MRLHSLCLALTLLAGSTAIGLAQSEFRKPFSGNEYTPRLSDIMSAAQSQHLKLWVAAKAQNWDLAAYEAQQLTASLAEAAMLYNGLPVTNVTTLMTPLRSISDAITAKNVRSFANGMPRANRWLQRMSPFAGAEFCRDAGPDRPAEFQQSAVRAKWKAITASLRCVPKRTLSFVAGHHERAP
jgi:hypothetical protein